jgi:hypothetical protein
MATLVVKITRHDWDFSGPLSGPGWCGLGAEPRLPVSLPSGQPNARFGESVEPSGLAPR